MNLLYFFPLFPAQLLPFKCPEGREAWDGARWTGLIPSQRMDSLAILLPYTLNRKANYNKVLIYFFFPLRIQRTDFKRGVKQKVNFLFHPSLCRTGNLPAEVQLRHAETRGLLNIYVP